MKYLVDANILSEAMRPSPSPAVVAWLSVHERSLCVDPIVLGELHFGILILPAGRKRAELEAWFRAVTQRITCVNWTSACGQKWARLVAGLRCKGRSMPIIDSMIAATALANDLTIVTRNIRDFRHAGVRLYNPFSR